VAGRLGGRANAWRVRHTGRPAALGALAVAVLSSFTAGPLIAATAPAPAAAVAAWRLWLAAAALAPFGLRAVARSPVLRTWRGRAWTAAAGLALAAHFYLWIGSLRLTAIAPATTLVNAAPLLLLALECAIFGRRPHPGQWAGVAVSLAGMALLGAADWTGDRAAAAGDALALGGAAASAVYLVAGRAVRPAMGAMPYNLCVFTLAAAALSLLASSTGLPLLELPLRIWILLAALAAGPTLLGHALANFSLAQLSPTAVSLAYLLEPVGGSLLGYLWLRQVPTWTEAAGAAVTLAGLAVYLLASPRAAAQPSAP